MQIPFFKRSLSDKASVHIAAALRVVSFVSVIFVAQLFKFAKEAKVFRVIALAILMCQMGGFVFHLFCTCTNGWRVTWKGIMGLAKNLW